VPNVVGQDTILDGDLPDKTANYSSLAAFAAKTQEDWDDELRGAEQTRWGDGVLGGLFDGLEQGKPFVAALIQALVQDAFEGIADTFENVGDALGAVASNFNGKWRDIINAKDAADYANAQLAVSTRPIVDLFDGAAGNLSASWDVDYVQPLAGGQVRQDGKGNCWWNGFGFAPRTAQCRYNAVATTTDVQIVTVVMPLAVQKPPLLGQRSHLRLFGRVDSTVDNYVYAEITNDSAELGCVVSGSETVWATTTTATQDGDVFDFLIGTGANNYYFRLRRNGIVIIDYDDVGNVSRKGASYRSVGFEMHAASRGVLGQTSPGTMAVFSADDN
jgi:hypothetical protein